MGQGKDIPPLTREIRVSPKYTDLIAPTGYLVAPTRYIILTGGRGSGKSYAVALALTLAARDVGLACLYTRWTMTSAKDSIIPEFQEKIDLCGAAGEFTTTARDITHATGSKIMFRGIKTSQGNQTANLKSLQGVNKWVLDEAEEMPDEATFDTIDLSIRDKRRRNHVILCLNPTHKRHWIYRRWFQGIPEGFNGRRGDVTYIHTDFRDNWNNLPDSYRMRIKDAVDGNPKRFRQIWLGAWVDEVQGALWSWDMIRHIDRAEVPPLRRVVVAVDPNTVSGPNADEAGIVIAGLGDDGNCYVLGDASARVGPAEWARIACQQYDVHQADMIVAEKNQGGEMVELTIRGYRRNVPVKLVNASRGKVTRAEPVASLYAQGKVFHVGKYAELESEMLSYTGEPGQSSPNRLDAMVWALSELTGGQAGAFVLDEMLKGCVV